MTTKQQVHCNVCGQQITDTGNIGRGIKFVGPGGRQIEFTTIRQAENHLCDNCVNALLTAFRQKAAA